MQPKTFQDRKIVPSVMLCLALVVLCSSCSRALPSKTGESDGSKLQGQLTLTGSSTVAPLAMEIGKRFESLHPAVRVDVQMGGSSRGIADARSGLADIGMVSRKLHAEESDLHGFTIAKDGLCLIVHRDNPVTELTNEQVIAIYTDRINNWKQVGGNDAAITVVHKAEGRATLELFLKYFGLENPAVKADVVIGDNEQGIKTVAGNPDAVGYVSIGAGEYDASHDVPIKLLPIGGVAATTANIRNGRFPLSRELNLVTKNKPQGLTKAFLDFARSNEVHDLIEEQYFVPLAK